MYLGYLVAVGHDDADATCCIKTLAAYLTIEAAQHVDDHRGLVVGRKEEHPVSLELVVECVFRWFAIFEVCLQLVGAGYWLQLFMSIEKGIREGGNVWMHAPLVLQQPHKGLAACLSLLA